MADRFVLMRNASTRRPLVWLIDVDPGPGVSCVYMRAWPPGEEPDEEAMAAVNRMPSGGYHWLDLVLAQHRAQRRAQEALA